MIVCGIGVSDRGKRAGGELYARKMFVSEYFVDISRKIPVRPTQHCPQNETGPSADTVARAMLAVSVPPLERLLSSPVFPEVLSSGVTTTGVFQVQSTVVWESLWKLPVGAPVSLPMI